MYIVVCPIALWMTHSEIIQLSDRFHFSTLLAVWLPAILEAIAWGTLFSLLTARPLVAVISAIAATSTVAHLLAWPAKTTHDPFELAAYLRVTPWRIAIATAVLAIDAVLGLRWLHGASSPRPKTKLASITRMIDEALPSVVAAELLARRGRLTMLGHLLWQHWRQSRWLTLGMVFLGLPASFFAFGALGTFFFPKVPSWSNQLTPLPFAIWTSLVGAMVFLSDQERRSYRFFREHNVPPRYVWLTRELLWLLVLFVTCSAICVWWLWNSGFTELWGIIQTAFSSNYLAANNTSTYLNLPPIGVALLCACGLRRRTVGIDVHSQRRHGGFRRPATQRRLVHLDAADARAANEFALVGCADSADLHVGHLAPHTRLDRREQDVARPWNRRCGRAASTVAHLHWCAGQTCASNPRCESGIRSRSLHLRTTSKVARRTGNSRTLSEGERQLFSCKRRPRS